MTCSCVALHLSRIQLANMFRGYEFHSEIKICDVVRFMQILWMEQAILEGLY